MKRLVTKFIRVALPFAGSAILLFSCERAEQPDRTASDETLMTEYSENLSIVESQNGRRSYRFVTPLVEGYTLAREPYREFRKGIKITTFSDDSLTTVNAVLTANYAINYTDRQLWEAKGNVVVEKADGRTLYTQQLFWNAKTGKIYSNVDSKIVQDGGRTAFIGEGFESDQEFKDWRFRKMKGRMEVDVTQKQPADSTAAASPGAEASGKPVSPPPAAKSAPAPSERPRSANPGVAPAPRESRPDMKPRPEPVQQKLNTKKAK